MQLSGPHAAAPRDEGRLTDHSKEVRVVHGALLVLTLLQVGSVQDPCHREAKVGSKGVNGHGATCILHLQPWESRGLLLQLSLILELRPDFIVPSLSVHLTEEPGAPALPG